MISVVLLPTAMFTAAPLWCNPCLDKEHCGGNELGNQSHIDDVWPDRSDNAWWVNKYCLMNQVGNAFNYNPGLISPFTGRWSCSSPSLHSDHSNDASLRH